MRVHILLLAATLLGVAVSPADAQRGRRPTTPRGWLGFSFDAVFTEPGERPRLVIRDVVEESPARRAGVLVGDTVLRVNGLSATDELMRTLSVALSPGDTVRLLVRRAAADREFTMQAAERPAEYATLQRDSRVVIIDPDSLRGRLHILIDSVRTRIDSLDLPRVYVEPRGGRFRMLTRDSAFSFFMDSLPGLRFKFSGDSLFHLRMDTVWRRLLPGGRAGMVLRGDSIMRFWSGDSIWRERFRPDSLASFYVDARGWPGYAVYGGVRAIAGAELTELGSGLADYFGVAEGVLVTRVPSGTPAGRTGLQEGDVIVRANSTDVSTIPELRSAIARAGANQPVQLVVVRKKERITLELKRE
jgi:membrane-associated protease RseP (regulator of RpoE activity)